MSDERDAIEQQVEGFGDSERSKHEPEEFDPASLGPDIPSVGTSESSELGGNGADDDIDPDVDEALAEGFYSAVLLANVGLFSLSLGVLLAYFRAQYILGGAAILVGLSALARTYWLVRKHGGGE